MSLLYYREVGGCSGNNDCVVGSRLTLSNSLYVHTYMTVKTSVSHFLLWMRLTSIQRGSSCLMSGSHLKHIPRITHTAVQL